MLRGLSQLSTPAGIVLFVIVPGLISAFLAVVVRRVQSIERLAENNEFAAITYPVIGLVYGVFLAFAVVIVWQRFTNAEDSSYQEVAALSQLWGDAQAFPAETREAIRTGLETYLRAVADQEWPSMAGANGEPVRDVEFRRLWGPYYAYTPATERERAFYAQSLGRLNDAAASRAERLMYSDSEMHSLLWAFLMFGAAVTIGFSLFLGTRQLWTHALTCAAISSLIGFGIFLVMSLQYPFAGPSSVKSTPYVNLLRVVQER